MANVGNSLGLDLSRYRELQHFSLYYVSGLMELTEKCGGLSKLIFFFQSTLAFSLFITNTALLNGKQSDEQMSKRHNLLLLHNREK